MRSLIIIVCSLSALTILAGNSCQRNHVDADTRKVISNQLGDQELMGLLSKKRILAFYSWEIGDNANEGKVFCLFTKVDHDSKYPENGVQFSVYDSAGHLLYQDFFSNLKSYYPVNALRTAYSQLALEVDSGGSGTYFLQLLDYKDGKIRRLLDPKQNDFNAMAEIKPQFRSDVVASREPFEIRLTRGVGLSSSAEKRTSVYRFEEGGYRYVGD